MKNGAGYDQLTRLNAFARVGHAARSIVYILLGYFSLTTAKGGGEGTISVLQQIQDMPLSGALLLLLGLGLLGWGVFRLYGAIIDIQGEGADAKGVATRAGHALSGLAHFVFCYFAIRLAFGSQSSGSGGQSKEAAASTVEQLPLGETLIALVAVGFALAALQQLVKAVTAKFMKLLSPDAPPFAEWMGRAGYAARAGVFGALAWQIFEVALVNASARDAGIGGALDALRGTGWLYTLVAFGLILFGIFSLVMARYRLIRDVSDPGGH